MPHLLIDFAHTANRLKLSDPIFELIKTYRLRRIRLNKLLARLVFFQRCKAKNVIPNAFKLPSRVFKGRCKIIINKMPQKLLSAAIRDLHADIGVCELKCYAAYQDLSLRLHPQAFDLILIKVHQLSTTHLQLEKSKFKKKFNFLEKKQKSHNPQVKNRPLAAKNFVNLSSTEIPKEVTDLLDHGPKFIPPTSINMKEVISSLESALGNVSNNQQQFIRTEVCNKLLNANQVNVSRKFSGMIKKAKKFIQTNDLAVCKADKSGIPVFIDKQQLNDKVSEFLTNTNCKLLKKDPTEACVRDIKRLSNSPHLLKFLGDFSPPPFTSAPKLFAQIKLHKDNKPIRPLVCSRTSPMAKLEKKLANACKFIVDSSPYKITSTNDFVTQLPSQIDSNILMITIDVVSLFPSIPQFESHMILMKYLINSLPLSNVLIKDLYDALDALRKFSYFEHDSKFYLQQSGLPMGSSLSPLLAEVFMMYVETNILFTEESEYKPLFWRRYVDDIFVLWPHTIDQLKITLGKVHEKYPSIDFTINTEVNSSIAFLDVNITRNSNNHLIRSVFRKDVAPPSIIPFTSYTYGPYKLSALSSLYRRCNMICNSEETRLQEIKNIKEIALFHKFPEGVINKMLQPNNHVQSALLPDAKKELKFAGSITFNKFSHIIQNSFRKYGFRIAIKSNPNIFQALRNDRSKTNPCSTPGVYLIPIISNNSPDNPVISTYIGSTCRTITCRVNEHKKNINNINYSSLTKFLNVNENLQPAWDQVIKIANENNIQKLRIRESLEIVTRNCCNEEVPRYVPFIWRAILSVQEEKSWQQPLGSVGADDALGLG